MSKKRQRKNERDFKTFRLIEISSRFLGSVITACFGISSILKISSTYEKNQTFGLVIFLVLSTVFIYLAIALFKQGIQAIRAKRMADLP
jgi:phosphoglycerol transferase MdoB-like AlkP superfamily enzyme